MTKQASCEPFAAVNTKFANTMDGRRPLASQDPNSSSVAAVAGGVSPAPPWKQPGAPVGTSTSSGNGPGAPAGAPGPGSGPGPNMGSTSTDSAMVPAQQAQPYPGPYRNEGRPAARRQHQDRRNRRRRRPSRNHADNGSPTLRYMHDQTTNIHDRLSGWQPGVPPEVGEWEETMRLGLDRLTEIIDQPSSALGLPEDQYGDPYGYVDAYGYPYYQWL